MRPPSLKSRSDSTQLVNPFALNQAILIGLSAEIPGLDKAIAQIQESIQEPAGIFPEFEMQTMTNLERSGNRTLLVHRLNSLAEASKVQSFENTLLYFVGHAEKKPSYRLLLPERIFNNKSPKEDRDWLGWETLCEWLAPLRTKNLLIVLDTCYASQLNHKETLKWLRYLDEQCPGQKIILAAGSDEPIAWEREWTCFFTAAMGEGLSGWNACNDRGVVDIDTMFAHLSRRVPEIAREKTNKAELRPYPFRLQWPERPDEPMALTHEKQRTGLGDELKNALLEGRTLLWVGDKLKHRSTPKDFPHRDTWESVQRDVWLEYVDSQRAPGVASMQLASFGMSILDTAVDTALYKACVKKHVAPWVPGEGTQPPPKEQPTLIRLCGELGTEDFVYEWEDLDQRFHALLDWLEQSRRWDSLLLLGFPMEELAARQWLKAICQRIDKCWMVCPFNDEHDRVPWLRELGVELLFAQDADVLKLLKDVARIGVKPDRTELVRFSFPKKQKQKGRDVASTPNPYRGLLPFGEMHYDTFYGRLRADATGGVLKDLREDVLRHQKVLLYGEPGVGKTSLLQAGIVPMLQQIDGYRVFFSDAEDALQDLAHKAADEPTFVSAPTANNILERLGFLSKQTGRPVLICIDHLERTLLQPPVARSKRSTPPAYLGILEEAVRKLEECWPAGQWRLLLCVRKDAYVHMKEFVARSGDGTASPLHHRELLPLDAHAARDAICGPVPEPFQIDEDLVERLLIDLRAWRPGHAPTYDPMWLQIVCREIFETTRQHAIKKKEAPVLSLAHYKQYEGGLSAWLHDKIHKQTLNRMKNNVRLAAQDILSLLLTDRGARRHRSWQEINDILKMRHLPDDLTDAKERLLNQQIVRERRIIHGPPHLELTHDALVNVVRTFSDGDLELASQLVGHLDETAPNPTPFPRTLLTKMKQRAGYQDRLPITQRDEVTLLREASTKHYRSRALVRSAIAIFAVLLLGLGWFYLPRSTSSTVDQYIAAMLDDETPSQKTFWKSIDFLKTEQAIGIAQSKLAQRLLRAEGKPACKLLRALFHISRGRVSESVRIYTKDKVPFKVTRLACVAGATFKSIDLRSAKLDKAQLPAAELSGASLQAASFSEGNLARAKLANANMLKTQLDRANLKDATLEGAQLQYANLNQADLRGASLARSALLGATFKGALLTSTQLKDLGEAGASLQDALCLSNKPVGIFLQGGAVACYLWHRKGDTQKARPKHCPDLLQGPILAYERLPEEGKCPSTTKKLLSSFSAYCPPNNRAACKVGKDCRSGNGNRCLELGQMYEAGKGVAQKPDIAAVLYRRACVNGAAAGCTALGQLFLRGAGVAQSDRKATALFEQSCKQNELGACSKLGIFYEKGLGRTLDVKRAQQLYQRACQGKIGQACARLGVLHQLGKAVKKDRGVAAQLFQNSCDHGHGAGCFRLAKTKRGRSQKKFFTKAATLLQSACTQQDGNACALRGIMQRNGDGQSRDLKAAKATLERACALKSGTGCATLAKMYQEGKGVRKSAKRGAAYLKLACLYAHGEACNNLAALYERGKGVRKSKRNTRKYNRLSCEHGYGWGCNDFAYLYEKGKGVRRNRRKARKLYKLACELGVNDACR